MAKDRKVNQNTEIKQNQMVKSYLYGNTLELTTSMGNSKQTIIVLPNHQYLVVDTGEVKQMKTNSTSREANLKSVKSTMKKLRRLIANNFVGKKSELWVTLTYKEHITDHRIAYRDFKNYIKRLRNRYGMVEYISVIEPQASGRWHFHVLIKSVSKKIFIVPNNIMEQIWGKGFTSTKRIKSSDKIGNYVIAYVSNLEVSKSDSDEKKYIKGARLYLYPKGIRIFRCSRGIVKPYEETNTKNNILKKYNLKNSIPVFSKKSMHTTKTGESIFYITEFYHVCVRSDVLDEQKEN